jgi:hypothetical protein
MGKTFTKEAVVNYINAGQENKPTTYVHPNEMTSILGI